ncbi:MAG: Ig-like domain-containing protein, partial [Pseudomonadota bacterium]
SAIQIGSADGTRDFSVQTADARAFDEVLDAIFGTNVTNIALSGAAASFGTFRDAFGADNGLVLSTGRVSDLAGRNIDAGAVTSQSAGGALPLIFEEVADGVVRARIPDLPQGLRTLTLVDDNDFIGGSAGRFSGLDLGAIVLSRDDGSSISTVTDLNGLLRLNVFDFTPAGLDFEPGTQRPTSNAGLISPDLAGSVNGLVDNSIATLGVAETSLTTGFLSFGDGGRLTLELTQPVDTETPLFLYLAEVGGTESTLAEITASASSAEPTGDASTDLGVAGAEGDTARLTAEFTQATASDLPVDLFQIVIATEELPEFGGADLLDLFSVKINGFDAAVLSDGRALTMDNLALSPIGQFSDDLTLNLPGDDTPLAAQLRADAVTRTLVVRAPVEAGVNTLEIEVADQRDGLLDSAIFVLPLGDLNCIDGTAFADNLTGTSGADKIRANQGNDLIEAGAGDDLVFGDGGADTYTDGAGSDTFDGGAGTDTARYLVDYASVTVSRIDVDRTTVTHNNGDVDTLFDVETLIFVGSGPGGADLVLDLTDDVGFAAQQVVAGDISLETIEDRSVVIDLVASGVAPGGGALTLSGIGTPQNGSLEEGREGDGTVTYTPDQDFFGQDSFVFQLTDQAGEIAEARVNILVAAENDAPVAGDDSASTDRRSSVTGNVIEGDARGNGADTDVDDTELTVTAVNGEALEAGTRINLPSGATVTFSADGGFEYDPGQAFELLAGENATDSFTYQVSDPAGASDEGLVKISISGANGNGDMNRDGLVDALDIPLIGAAFGGIRGDAVFGAQYDIEADLDGDGVVSGLDITLLLEQNGGLL